MLNKLLSFIRRYDMIHPGDTVICAVSGGADSVALLFAMYLLREKLGIRLAAAHFDHQLRGQESDADAAFVRELCQRYDIRLYMGSGQVVAGAKGLEAAARDARYAFLQGLPGKIATAHTADDNAETVLMHLVRGTGLKGLGAIAPVRGQIIRPMLTVTRAEVLAFLEGYSLPHREDSSNGSDRFLRNRIRHHVMPLLRQENPKLAENLSQMALRLRQDEEVLSELAQVEGPLEIQALRAMPEAQRSRVLERFLKDNGVREPEAEHIALADAVVFSERPSAKARFPGGITLGRCYGSLQIQEEPEPLEPVVLACPGATQIPQLGLTVLCQMAEGTVDEKDCFTVDIHGKLTLRCRAAGDKLRRSGGTRTLKKLFIDRKIPVDQRCRVPVLCDDEGVVAVYGIGADLERIAPVWQIRFIKTES